ncbi:MAG: RNA polymerase sigma factor [Planctomycetaceae bacterium]|jgi:RNA polymerase sigma-70 factor (ECF subfamily)
MPSDDLDRLLVARIRQGDPQAWSDCIARFEGRLLAFVQSRLRDRAQSEDVVQETFLGFVIALPNYDDQTPLESFLFAIAAHKLTDTLRRLGRRPTLPLEFPDSQRSGAGEIPASVRMASSLALSRERRGLEADLLTNALRQLIRQWRERREFERLKVIELLFVLGWPNKRVATELGISEQAVANHKHFVVGKLKEFIRQATQGQSDGSELGLAD